MIETSKIFVDSGAHSIFVKEAFKKGNNCHDYSYYETDSFWQYVDDYANFIKENIDIISVYVNVDVIGNSELTWKVQRYLEDTHKLKPMPVFHVGEDFLWYKKYLDNYDYIGIGGLGQENTKAKWMRDMGDPIFDMICKSPTFIPTHKIHGFAMTSPSLLTAYPWYSVDSTSWIQFGKYGAIIIPRKKGNSYDYSKSPYIVFVTSREAKKGHQAHLDNFVDMHQEYFYEYLTEKGFIIGNSTFKTIDPVGYKLANGEHWADRKIGLVETVVEEGLCNNHELRDRLNVMFYLDLEAQLPPWPYAWNKKVKNTRLF